METTSLDPETQKQAKEFSKIQRRLFLLEIILIVFYLLIWLAFNWSTNLSTTLQSFTNNSYLLVAAMGLILGGIFSIATFPLSLYEGYTLPHKYGLSNQTLKEWLYDQFKELLILLVIGGLLLEVIYYVLRVSPTNWWLWAAIFLLIFNVLLANLAPVLLFPLFYKFTPLADEYQSLRARLLELAKKSNVIVTDVYQFDMSRKTKAANAALAGLGNTRRIILGDTLIKEFTQDEIETVLAHELGHQVHKDIVLGIIVQSLITLIGFYSVSLILTWGIQYFGFKGPADIAAMPLFVLTLVLFGIITMPVSNAYSRWREKLADEYALELTHNGQAFASALTRLANQNLADANPEEWVEFLLYSHPALNKRIHMAEEYTQTK